MSSEAALRVDSRLSTVVTARNSVSSSLRRRCKTWGALIGDDFLRRLQKNRTPSDSEDVLVREIETALRLQVTIYPFLFGARDMPGAEQLPESIKGFAKRQAIFAREPAFDTAMVVLGNALRSDHRLGPAPAGRDRRLPLLGTLSPPQALALASISAVAVWFIGSSISLLAALPGHDTSPLQLEFWRAAKYLLLTTLIGLGPYASYWLVAVPRARARLPIRDFGGLLSAFNIGAALVLGASSCCWRWLSWPISLYAFGVAPMFAPY